MSESYPGWPYRRTVPRTNKEDRKAIGQMVQKDDLASCWCSEQMSGLRTWPCSLISLPGPLTLLPYLAGLIPGLGTPIGHSKLVWSPRICSYGFLQLPVCPWSVPARLMCTYWFTDLDPPVLQTPHVLPEQEQLSHWIEMRSQVWAASILFQLPPACQHGRLIANRWDQGYH